MAHNHAHGSSGSGSNSSTESRLAWALGLVTIFMVVEAVGGLLSGSLALLADAGHMLTDALALGLAMAAFWFGRRPPDPSRSYGYRRFEVLAAWFNGVVLFGLALWIMVEAAFRILEPVPVLAPAMMVVAVIGLVVNIVTLWILRGGEHDHINIHGALVHVIGDLLGSVAAIAAAVVILFTGWTPIDPLLSVLVAVLILRSAWILVRRATHILLEGTPEELDLDNLREELLRAVPEVTDVHHVHAWSLTSGAPLITMHACVSNDADRDGALRAIKRLLADMFRISHSVIQIEAVSCPDETGTAGPAAALALSLFLVAGAAVPGAAAATDPSGGEATVFAAASVTNAVEELAARFAATEGGHIVTSFASSSTLARQIASGAPADIFISADPRWMDYLARRGRIDPATRAPFLHNRLVLIVPRKSSLSLTIAPGFPLAKALGDGRLAMGDPDHVPAGMYAKAALLSLGVWDQVRSRIAPMADVRAALALVERGETPAGIVYATDARITDKVRVAGIFPSDSHPPITYVVALVEGCSATARRFRKYLTTAPAREVFEKRGFTMALPPG